MLNQSEPFTEGPWHTEYDVNTGGTLIRAHDGIVATAHYLAGTIPAKKNARLIAAAPEMFLLLDQITALERICHEPNCKCRSHALVQSANGVIAQIRGAQK